MKAQKERMQLLVSQWQESGMSQAEFARKYELNLHGFRYWVSKLRKVKEEDYGFIALSGFASPQIILHYPNGVELLLPPQTPVSVYDPVNKLVLFDYQKSRWREGPDTFLEKFSGHLQTDGYTAYTNLKTSQSHFWPAWHMPAVSLNMPWIMTAREPSMPC